MKVVINSCFGGFRLSQKALLLFKQYKADRGLVWSYNFERNDPILIEVVEELGIKEASDALFSSLRIIEIPDDIEWLVEDFDGLEHVAEKHRCWH